VTRTPLASTHILSILAGSSQITVPCLASALVALYLTLNFPFIMSQRDRQDMVLKVCSLPPPPLPGAGLNYQQSSCLITLARLFDLTDKQTIESCSWQRSPPQEM
jgi:hypothetical protein